MFQSFVPMLHSYFGVLSAIAFVVYILFLLCFCTQVLAKLRNVTIRFFMPVCPSVRVEHLGSQRKAFLQVPYLNIFRKYVYKIQVLLQFDNSNEYIA